MGTSTYSRGPGKNVPFDPEWLDDIEDPFQDSSNDMDQYNNDQEPKDPEVLFLLAPERRFANARRAFGNFVRTGDRSSLVKAFGHYSKTGMGGSSNVAKRMRISTRTAVNLFGLFLLARGDSEPTISEWVRSLRERAANATEIINEIIRMVTPNGGSLDEHSYQNSVGTALQHLLEMEPYVDLLNLSDDNIWYVIESYLATEAFNRLCLDIGQALVEKPLSPKERVMRENDMNEYLRAEISVQLRLLRTSSQDYASSSKLTRIIQSALENTFRVYEGSI